MKKLTRIEAADYLKVSHCTLNKLRATKNFPRPIKYPGCRVIFFVEEELEKWQMSQRG